MTSVGTFADVSAVSALSDESVGTTIDNQDFPPPLNFQTLSTVMKDDTEMGMALEEDMNCIRLGR